LSQTPPRNFRSLFYSLGVDEIDREVRDALFHPLFFVQTPK
jgi:hypothetical protein